MQETNGPGRAAFQAAGRCTGALFFSIFGGCWMLLACAYSGHFRVGYVVADICVVLMFVTFALYLKRAGGGSHDEAVPEAERSANDRTFLWINGVTWTLVFLLFLILPRLHLSNYVFPGFVALVGVHFFPMPPLYRHRSNLVVGGAMVVCAVVCAMLFRANGNIMAAWVGLGAGLALWFGAAWALRTAQLLLQQASRYTA